MWGIEQLLIQNLNAYAPKVNEEIQQWCQMYKTTKFHNVLNDATTNANTPLILLLATNRYQYFSLV